MTKHGPPYTPDEWIKEIPFDIAEWGDKEGSFEGGRPLFESEEEFQQALRDSAKLPKHPPLPGLSEKRAREIFEARQRQSGRAARERPRP